MDQRTRLIENVRSSLKLTALILIFIASLAGLIICALAFMIAVSPDVSQLRKCMTTSMFNVEVCPGSSSYISIDRIPETLIDALVVSEDAAFFTHSGFDWYELRESLEKNIAKGAIARGGSTLTQQLAKNAFLSADKSILRKLREAYITYQIEANFTKREILEKYLNMVEFGEGIYGIRQASQHYFNKPPQDLHLLESVSLVMLLPNPKKYSQSFHERELTDFAQKMMRVILTRMVRYNKISKATYTFAKENIEGFPWSYLSQADFRFSLPDLPSEVVSPFDTATPPVDDEILKEEIGQQVDEALEQESQEMPNEELENSLPEDEDVPPEEEIFPEEELLPEEDIATE